MESHVIVRPLTRSKSAAGLGVRQAVVANLILCLAVASCTIPISYYDATTYKNLTGLKAEMCTLVESFDSQPVAANEAAIRQVSLEFRKAYEYERGKGEPNSDTVKQFEKIKGLFDDDVKSYRDGRSLGEAYYQEAANTLGQAFDIVIGTENEKNEDKR